MRRYLRFAYQSVTLSVLLCLVPGDGRAQDPTGEAPPPASEHREPPADIYGDIGVQTLIERARLERRARARGLGSFEATFRERIYAGLGGRVVRRERAMFHQERAARVYWDADAEHVVRWLGVRQGVPIAGVGTEIDEDIRGDEIFDFEVDVLDPADDHVTIGSDWALHPLADTAVYHYRFRSGDTLRIRFPGAERTVTLIEAVVEPREARFDRIVGSLWFDAEEGVMTRAAYRPAIEYDFDREEPDEADDVPGFVKPLRATVDFITIDYGLQELRWWLPNRMAFDATATAGGLATMPVRLEWTFDDYTVDEPPSVDPEDLPEGWTTWVDNDYEAVVIDGDTLTIVDGDTIRAELRDVGDDGRQRRPRRMRDDPLTAERDSTLEDHRPIIMIVPPVDSLLTYPDLPEPLFSGSVDAFSEAELDQLKDRLGSIPVPQAELLGPRFDFGLWPGRFRFNRVEGLAPSVRFAWPTGVASELAVTSRIGIPEWEPGVEVEWSRQTAKSTFGITAYRRLIDLGDWGRPLSFGNTFNSLVTGYDDGLYFRETGLEIAASHQGARVRWEGSVFAERHQNADKQTDASLPNLLGDRLFPPNIRADRGEIAGISGRMRVFTSVDPSDPALSATVWGEAAGGDFDYGRIAGSAALVVPMGAWNAAVEGSSGTTFGSPPAQRLFHLGGPYTLRAFEPGSAGGESFWFGRVELGKGFRVASDGYGVSGSTFRVTAFGDAGWAGPRDAFGTDGWQASVGAGFSIMEGFFRLDIARGVQGGNAWRVHIYTDGLM
ncbi:MAG: hypothetical protein MJB57_00955 [Gemmatimonadetes bacterium]|nr:hypothetical protein [Gemmatimonadota bacterium]